jgi:N-acetylmuramic acid 6-phosphate (MurNAc-6-P) etherase
MLGDLETESRAAALSDLDRRPALDIVRAVVRGHRDVLAAVEAAEPAIAALVDAAVPRLDAGSEHPAGSPASRRRGTRCRSWSPSFCCASTS